MSETSLPAAHTSRIFDEDIPPSVVESVGSDIDMSLAASIARKALYRNPPLALFVAPSIQRYAWKKNQYQCIQPGPLSFAWDAAHPLFRLWGDQRRVLVLQWKYANIFDVSMARDASDPEKPYCVCIANRGDDIRFGIWWLERNRIEDVLRTIVIVTEDVVESTQALRNMRQKNCVQVLCVNVIRTEEAYNALGYVAEHQKELHSFQGHACLPDPLLGEAMSRMTRLTQLKMLFKGEASLNFLSNMNKLLEAHVICEFNSTPKLCRGIGLFMNSPHLRRLTIACGSTEPDIERLANCKALQHLTLTGIRNLDQNVLFIDNLKLLKTLSLTSCSSLRDVHVLASNCNLREVDLSNTHVTDGGLERLRSCSTIEVLNLSLCLEVCEVTHVAQLPNLKDLNLEGTSVISLRNYKVGLWRKLESINLSRCSALVDIAAMAQFPQLKRVALMWSPIRTLGFYNPGEWVALEIIDFSWSGKLTDVSALPRCNELKSVNLRGTQVSGFGADFAGSWPQLERINLYQCTSFYSVAVLSKCSKLKNVNVSGTPISDLGRANEDAWTNLETICASDCRSLADVSGLSGCKELREVDLKGTPIPSFTRTSEGQWPKLKTVMIAKFVDVNGVHAREQERYRRHRQLGF